MSIKDALTWAGGDAATWTATLVAVLGMVGSWWQAKRARGAATDAEKIRDEVAGEIAQRGAHGELSDLYNQATKAVEAMDKYGPGASVSNQRGSKADDDAAVVRKLTTMLSLHKAMLEKSFQEIDKTRNNLNTLLNEFSSSKNSEERLQKGNLIHRQLTDLSGNLKNSMDRHLYRQPAIQPPKAENV